VNESSARCTAPVFVVGSPRSGTTLLYHLLLSAGGFAVYRAEASVFNLLSPRFGDLSERRNRTALLDAWLPSEFFRRSGLEPEAFRELVQERCRSAGDLLRLFMDSIATRQGVRRWAECTPENLLYIDVIKRSIPDAVFLHIVRDGRDVACSLAGQGWIGRRLSDPGARVFLSGLYWQWMVRRGRESLLRYAHDTKEVRFEELVADPRAILAKVSAFVGHDLNYSRIRERGIGTVRRPNTSFPARHEEPEFQPVGRWKTRFKGEELARFEAATGQFLTELGYALESDAGTRERLARRALVARQAAQAYFGSRHWLKVATPLGRVFTNDTLLHDFGAFDRDRLVSLAERKVSL
jgi:LPS sulfotransferase NodH